MIHFQAQCRFTVFVLTAITFLALTVTGCQPQKQADPPEKITIAYSTSVNAILMAIALANDYFKEEGLDVTPQPHAFGKPALQSVIEGKADIATVGDTPIVFAVMGGRKITALATIQTSNIDHAIAANRERGIAGPSDLKGKTIGLTWGTTGHFFACSFLQVYGISEKQVRIIDLKPDEMAAAFAAGKVDAVSTWNPFLIQLKKNLGSKGIFFFDKLVATEVFIVAAGQEYVNKNPEAVKKVLRALIKAEAYAWQHPEESRRLVAEFIKVDKAIIDEVWDIFNLQVVLDQALVMDLEDQTRWAIKHGLVERRDMPNYLDFIYFDGLLAVKPDAVRIIR